MIFRHVISQQPAYESFSVFQCVTMSFDVLRCVSTCSSVFQYVSLPISVDHCRPLLINVAVDAFVSKVALRCVQYEVVAPLIDQVALLADQKLALFIRESGGWYTFAHFFWMEERSWLYGDIATFIKT